MPIRKLVTKLEQDLSFLLWQGRVYGLSHEQLAQRYRKLAVGYRKVVLAEDAVQLEQLLTRTAARLKSDR